MIFDVNGLPKDTGASDYADSARLAGLMALFGHPMLPSEKLSKYIKMDENGKLVGVRYPYTDPLQEPEYQMSSNPKNFTRDQLICLSGGLAVDGYCFACFGLLKGVRARWYRAQNTEYDVPGSTKKFPNGADIITPDVVNHLRIGAGLKPLLIGKVFLILQIIFTSLFTSKEEQNQLISLCVVAGPFYVKLLKRLNKNLYESFRIYWGGWRREPEFAEFIISKLEEY